MTSLLFLIMQHYFQKYLCFFIEYGAQLIGKKYIFGSKILKTLFWCWYEQLSQLFSIVGFLEGHS